MGEVYVENMEQKEKLYQKKKMEQQEKVYQQNMGEKNHTVHKNDIEQRENKEQKKGIEQKEETEQTKKAKQKEMAVKKHKFKQKIDLANPISRVGDAAVDAVAREVENGDEEYASGVRETRKYIMPSMDALALLSAREMAKGIKAEFRQVTSTTNQVYHLVQSGKISMVDLGDKKLLGERLEKMDDISFLQKRKIMKHRESAYDFLAVKEAIKKRTERGVQLEEALKVHLGSEDFFDLSQKKTNDLLKVYFQTSDNDVLKNVNPAGMRVSQINKLLKSSKRNDFTVMDEAALRVIKRQMKYRESRIKIGRLLNIRKRIEMIGRYMQGVDSAVSEGFRQITYMTQISYAGIEMGKFGIKAGIVSASFVGKYSGLEFVLQQLNMKRKEVTQLVRENVKEAVVSSTPYKAVNGKVTEIKDKGNAVKSKVKDSLNENTAVQKYKKVRGEAREKAKVASKKANQAKAAAKKAGQQVARGVDVIASPVRFVGKTVNGIFTGLGKIKFALLAGVGIVIAVFILIVVAINAILSSCQMESNAALSAILTEDENFVSDMCGVLQVKADEKKAEAEQIANGTPKTTSVLEGHTISKYGHPDGLNRWISGAKINYVDDEGNVILNGSNNIKECIALAYVVFDGDFDSNTAARDEFISDLWDMMNPEVTYKESDIYTCPYGCGSFTYSCYLKEDYETIDKYKKDGVAFFGNVFAFSEYRDRYIVTCNGCEDADKKSIIHPEQKGSGEAKAAEGCTNYTIEYFCDGHALRVCYGHRDVDITIKIMTLEQVMASGSLPETKGKKYKAFVDKFAGWTDDNKEWARILCDGDWLDLYGTDPSGGTGYTAGAGMTDAEIAAIVGKYGSVDATRLKICTEAMSFVGKIPYYWSGKASTKDEAGNHFGTTVAADSKGRTQKGLDCSGFVQWIVWRVTDIKIGASTSTITSGMSKISASELQPGDLGLMAEPGAASNHVGIFVGYNDSGQALWCHENSSSGNVAVNTTTCFKQFYKIL